MTRGVAQSLLIAIDGQLCLSGSKVGSAKVVPRFHQVWCAAQRAAIGLYCRFDLTRILKGVAKRVMHVSGLRISLQRLAIVALRFRGISAPAGNLAEQVVQFG